MKRRGGGKRLRTAAPQLEIVAFGDRLQQRDPLPMVDRDRADEGNLDIRRGRGGQGVENGRLERQMADFRRARRRPGSNSQFVGSCEIIRS